MSLNYVATEDWEYKFSEGDGNVKVENDPSSKVKCGGKKAFFDKITVSISEFVIPNVLSQGNGSGEIKGSAQKLKIEGMSAVLEGDESDDISIAGVNPAGTTVVKDVKIKVLSAGQTKVKAE